MPLWTSFSVNDVTPGTGSALWSSDVRLTPETTITCQDYESLLPQNVTMGPLFPPGKNQLNPEILTAIISSSLVKVLHTSIDE